VKLPQRIIAIALRRGERQSSPTQSPPVTPPLARLAAALLSLAAATAFMPAQAALGQGAASIESDRMEVRASVRQVSHAAFTVHELTTAANGVVREYVSPAGQVFAVTWHGPSMPNLRQLLGTEFDVLAAAKHRKSSDHRHLSINEGQLVFESNGRMRSFNGRAYLANALPAGVSTNDIE
jgi:hypothetical protein